MREDWTFARQTNAERYFAMLMILIWVNAFEPFPTQFGADT